MPRMLVGTPNQDDEGCTFAYEVMLSVGLFDEFLYSGYNELKHLWKIERSNEQGED